MMLTVIPEILKHWRWALMGFFVALCICLYGYGDYRSHQVKELRTQVTQLHVDVETQQAKVAQDAVAMNELTARLKARQRVVLGTQSIIERAQHATPKDDGAVAPVLRDTLAGLGKLRSPAPGRSAKQPDRAKRPAELPAGAI